MSRANPRKRQDSKTNPRFLSVVTREGKTTVRQFNGRRFVRFGEVQGKRVSYVEFFTAGPNMHSIGVHFQDRTAFYLDITPLFVIRPAFCSSRKGDLKIIKEWPEIKIER
jgi:hypothetical protein